MCSQSSSSPPIKIHYFIHPQYRFCSQKFIEGIALILQCIYQDKNMVGKRKTVKQFWIKSIEQFDFIKIEDSIRKDQMKKLLTIPRKYKQLRSFITYTQFKSSTSNKIPIFYFDKSENGSEIVHTTTNTSKCPFRNDLDKLPQEECGFYDISPKTSLFEEGYMGSQIEFIEQQLETTSYRP